MSNPVRGFGASLGIGVQSVYETAVARTNWKQMLSMGLHRMITNKPLGELGELGAVSSAYTGSYVESDFAGGPIEFYAAYDDSTIMLLGYLLGVVDTTGTNPYVHDVTLATPAPVGLTLEQISGTPNAGLTTMAEVFHGCKAASGKLSVTNGGILTIEMELIGRTSAGLVAAGTPTYSTGGELVKHNQTVGISLGGTPRAINSISVMVTRGVERNQELGSLFTSEPTEGQVEVTFEIRTKLQTSAFDVAFLAGTRADITIPFVGSGVKELLVTLHNCQVDEVTRDVNSKGAIEQVIKGRAYSDGTNQGLSMAFTNANANAGAN